MAHWKTGICTKKEQKEPLSPNSLPRIRSKDRPLFKFKNRWRAVRRGSADLRSLCALAPLLQKSKQQGPGLPPVLPSSRFFFRDFIETPKHGPLISKMKEALQKFGRICVILYIILIRSPFYNYLVHCIFKIQSLVSSTKLSTFKIHLRLC